MNINFDILLEPIKLTEKLFYQETCRQAPVDFIDKHAESLNWEMISTYNGNLTDDLLEKHKEKVFWLNLCTHNKISENIIRKFKDRVDWSIVSSNQILSESFIKEFEDFVNWFKISKYQKLSSKFILENIEKINLDAVSRNAYINKAELNTPEFTAMIVLLGYDSKMFSHENFMYRRWRRL